MISIFILIYFFLLFDFSNADIYDLKEPKSGSQIRKSSRSSNSLGEFVWPSEDYLEFTGYPIMRTWTSDLSNSTFFGANFPLVGVMARLDSSSLNFYDVLNGTVLKSLKLSCSPPLFMVPCGWQNIGYYTCADGTNVVFNASTMSYIATFSLSGRDYNRTVYPYSGTNDHFMFEIEQHFYSNVLLLQVVNPATGKEGVQPVVLNNEGSPSFLQPIAPNGKCPHVALYVLRPDIYDGKIGVFMVCSDGSLHSVQDIYSPRLMSIALNSASLRLHPDFTYGKSFRPEFNSIAIAYTSSSDPNGEMSFVLFNITSLEIEGEQIQINKTNSSLCAQPKLSNTFTGHSLIVNKIFVFMSPCGVYGVNITGFNQAFSAEADFYETFVSLFNADFLSSFATVTKGNRVQIRYISNGYLKYEKYFPSKSNITIKPVFVHNAFRHPGRFYTFYSKEREALVVLTDTSMSMVDLFDYKIFAIQPELFITSEIFYWFPFHHVFMGFRADGALVTYSTQIGLEFFSGGYVSKQNGALILSIKDNYTYDQNRVIVTDSMGRVFWRSEDSFGRTAMAIPVMDKFILVISLSNIVVLDSMTGKTLKELNFVTSCSSRPITDFTIIIDPLNFATLSTRSATFFVIGNDCLYHLDQALNLKGYGVGVPLSSKPSIDEQNHAVIVHSGSFAIAVDINGGAVRWRTNIGSQIMTILPLSSHENSSFPATVAFAISTYAVHTLDHKRNGAIIWSYTFNSTIDTIPVIFNNMLFLKAGTMLAGMSLDPTVSFEKRLVWIKKVPGVNVARPGSLSFIVTFIGTIFYQQQGLLMGYNFTQGDQILNVPFSCRGSDPVSLEFYPSSYFLIARCVNSAHIIDPISGKELLVGHLSYIHDIFCFDDILTLTSLYFIATFVIPHHVITYNSKHFPLPKPPSPTPVPTLPSGAPLPHGQVASATNFSGLQIPPLLIRGKPVPRVQYAYVTGSRAHEWNVSHAISYSRETLYAINITTLLPLWNFTFKYKCLSMSTAAFGVNISKGVVLTTCGISGNFTLYGLNAKTGTQLWKPVSVDTGNILGDPWTHIALFHSYIRNQLVAIDVFSGTNLWSKQWDRNVPSSFAIVYRVRDQISSAVVLYSTSEGNLTLLDINNGAVLKTIVDQSCNGTVYIPAVQAHRIHHTHIINGVNQVFYQCGNGIHRLDIAGGAISSVAAINTPILSLSYTPTLHHILVTEKRAFTVISTNTSQILYTHYINDSEHYYLGITVSTYFNYVLLAKSNVSTDYLHLVALPFATNGSKIVEPLWISTAGVSERPLLHPKYENPAIVNISKKAVALLCGSAFIFEPLTGRTLGWTSDDVLTFIPSHHLLDKRLVEGYVTKEANVTILASINRYEISHVALPPESHEYGFLYYRTFHYVHEFTFNNSHYSLIVDTSLNHAVLKDNGAIVWGKRQFNAFSVAPLYILDTGVVVVGASAYLGFFHRNGLQIVDAMTGKFIYEFADHITAGITFFTQYDSLVTHGDSFYVISREIFLRYDPTKRNMQYVEVVTNNEVMNSAGPFSVDQSVFTVITSRNNIIGINTTNMTVLWMTYDLRNVESLRIMPSSSERPIFPRGNGSAFFEYFIAFNSKDNTLIFISYSNGTILRTYISNETLNNIAISPDGYTYALTITNKLLKLSNVLTVAPKDQKPVWMTQLDVSPRIYYHYPPSVIVMPNMGLVVVSYSCIETISVNSITGAIVNLALRDYIIEKKCSVKPIGQKVNSPLTSDALVLNSNDSFYVVSAIENTTIYSPLSSANNVALLNAPSSFYYSINNTIGLLPIIVNGNWSNTSGLAPMVQRILLIPANFVPKDYRLLPTPFSLDKIPERRGARVWRSDQNGFSIGFFNAFIPPHKVVISMNILENHSATISCMFAHNGSAFRSDFEALGRRIDSKAWIGHLNRWYGAYYKSGTLVVFDITKTLSIVVVAQLPTPPIEYASLYSDSTRVMPIIIGNYTCLALTENNTIACINLGKGVKFGSIVYLNLNGPIRTAPSISMANNSAKIVIITDNLFRNNTITFNVFSPDSSSPLTTVDFQNVKATRFLNDTLVTFSYDKHEPLVIRTFKLDGSPTGNPVISISDTGVPQLFEVYKFSNGRFVSAIVGKRFYEYYLFVFLYDLVSGDFIWNNKFSRKGMMDVDALSVISTSPRGFNETFLIVQTTESLIGLSITTGTELFLVYTEFAGSLRYLLPAEYGFLMYGNDYFYFANMSNLENSYFVDTIGTSNDIYFGWTIIESFPYLFKNIDGHIHAYAVPKESGWAYTDMFSEENVADKYLLLRGAYNSVALLNTEDLNTSWAVYTTNESYTYSSYMLGTYVDDSNRTVFIVDQFAVTGLFALNGSLKFYFKANRCSNAVYSSISAMDFDRGQGLLYIGYGKCVTVINSVGKVTTISVLGYIGNTMSLTNKCLLVSLMYGDLHCISRRNIKAGIVWNLTLGFDKTPFFTEQYDNYLVISRSGRQVMIEESTGHVVFYKSIPGGNRHTRVFDHYLIELTDSVFAITNLFPLIPYKDRTVAMFRVDDLFQTKKYIARCVSRPFVLPWGVVVFQTRSRIFGFDLNTLRFVFNKSAGKDSSCDDIIYVPYKGNNPAERAIQNNVLISNGDLYDAFTGDALAMYPIQTTRYRTTLLPNGVFVLQFSHHMVVTKMPFSYLSYRMKSMITPTPTPMSTATSAGPLPSGYTPQGDYPTVPTLPSKVTVPNVGCAIEIENQLEDFNACIYKFILSQQNKGTMAVNCTDLGVDTITKCVNNWVVTIRCYGSIIFFSEVLKNLKLRSPGFPYCTDNKMCTNPDGNTVLCGIIDKVISWGEGQTLYPGYTLPPPANVAPIYSTMPSPTMPPPDQNYYEFKCLSVELFPLSLDQRLSSYFGLSFVPVVDITKESDFVVHWRFQDPNLALAYSKKLAIALFNNYSSTISYFRMVSMVALPYVPSYTGTTSVSTTTTKPGPQPSTTTTKPGPQPSTTTTKPGPQPSTTTTKPGPQPSTTTTKPGPQPSTTTTKPGPQPSTTTASTTPIPTTTPVIKTYLFKCTAKEIIDNSPVPPHFELLVKQLLLISRNPILRYTDVDLKNKQFIFDFAIKSDSIKYSPMLADLIKQDPISSAKALQLLKIEAISNLPPTTAPTSSSAPVTPPSKSKLSAGAIFGIVIAFIVVFVVILAIVVALLRRRSRHVPINETDFVLLEEHDEVQ